MRTFKRLEIESIGSDAFGLGSSIRTYVRQLSHDSAEVYEAGADATKKVFDWLKLHYFGCDQLCKMFVNDYIGSLKDKNLAELLKRVIADDRNGLVNSVPATSGSKR